MQVVLFCERPSRRLRHAFAQWAQQKAFINFINISTFQLPRQLVNSSTRQLMQFSQNMHLFINNNT